MVALQAQCVPAVGHGCIANGKSISNSSELQSLACVVTHQFALGGFQL